MFGLEWFRVEGLGFRVQGSGFRGYLKLRTRTSLESYRRAIPRSIGPP